MPSPLIEEKCRYYYHYYYHYYPDPCLILLPTTRNLRTGSFSDSANLYHLNYTYCTLYLTLYALGNLPSFPYPYDYERNETNKQTDESETVKR